MGNFYNLHKISTHNIMRIILVGLQRKLLGTLVYQRYSNAKIIYGLQLL